VREFFCINRQISIFGFACLSRSDFLFLFFLAKICNFATKKKNKKVPSNNVVKGTFLKNFPKNRQISQKNRQIFLSGKKTVMKSPRFFLLAMFLVPLEFPYLLSRGVHRAIFIIFQAIVEKLLNIEHFFRLKIHLNQN